MQSPMIADGVEMIADGLGWVLNWWLSPMATPGNHTPFLVLAVAALLLSLVTLVLTLWRWMLLRRSGGGHPTPSVPAPEAIERRNGVSIWAPHESPVFHESESK
ncbi:UNVERIFIED_ORG: hypothetical protein M2328_006819 [Rhodococcus erythropolis]